MILRILLLAGVLGLTGCALVPENLAVPEGTSLVSYQQAATGGQQNIGRTARWGGVIVGVQNKAKKTFVEVVHFPLNHYGRPNTSEQTVGRFKVQIDGFVDPIVFEEGRAVTFIGSVGKPIAGMVGEQPYMYPSLNARDYHFWREVQTYDVSTLYFNYNTGWYSPFYYRHYQPFGFGPGWGFGTQRVRVIESRGFQPKLPKSGERPPVQLRHELMHNELRREARPVRKEVDTEVR